MFGLGTIINVSTVIVGGIFGMLFGKRITDRFRDTLVKAMGVCVLFIGISGALQYTYSIIDGKLESKGTMMMIFSIAIGALAGELLNIEGAFERFGEWLKRVSKSDGDNRFVDAFLTTSFTVCIGAMAIVGSLQDGMTGDYSTLLTKSILDCVMVMLMTSSMGKGCIFSAVPIFILQGGVTLLARFISPIMTETALSNLSLVGSVLIFCVGLNLVWGKTIKVANLLPSIIVAVAWAFLPFEFLK